MACCLAISKSVFDICRDLICPSERGNSSAIAWFKSNFEGLSVITPNPPLFFNSFFNVKGFKLF
jgi:hypothetical protein